MASQVRYPVRPLYFRILNQLIQFAPVERKYRHNSILFRKSVGQGKEIDVPSEYDFRLASSNDLDFIANHPESLAESVYSNRIKRGDRCYCLCNGREVLSYNWVATSLCCILCGYDRGLEFLPLLKNQAFTYDFYTYKNYRGSGFGSLMKDLLVWTLRQEGISEIRTLIMPYSSASIKIHLKLGYEPLCMVYGYRLLGLSKTFYGKPQDKPWLDEWINDFKIAAGIG